MPFSTRRKPDGRVTSEWHANGPKGTGFDPESNVGYRGRSTVTHTEQGIANVVAASSQEADPQAIAEYILKQAGNFMKADPIRILNRAGLPEMLRARVAAIIIAAEEADEEEQ